MSSEKTVTETYVTPAPDDIVSFAVIGQSASGASIGELRDRLTLATLRQYEASESTLRRVKQQVKALGFEVFDLPSPVVSARGRVDRFESEFKCKLLKRIRTTTTGKSTRTTSAIVLAPDSDQPSLQAIEGALLIVVVAPGLPVVPAVPPTSSDFNLHLPGDLAQLTGASATHRLTTALGERATGAGVGVAVIDTGFALHPYFDQHGYNITRLAAPDASDPDVDDDAHGTAVLAAMLACAPDVDAVGIKAGDNEILSFDLAMTLPTLKVISISWVHNLVGQTTLPLDLVPLWIRILDTINAGVTVVAAAGNGQTSFPAMMPDVIAVGGAAINAKDKLEAWNGGSSFSSAIFAMRNVPDVCAFASDMWLPSPGQQPDWMQSHGTSFAAPQVAGIAALLLQKNVSLGPNGVRASITATAIDITKGKTAFGDKASAGNDRATGAGLVCARKAWQVV